MQLRVGEARGQGLGGDMRLLRLLSCIGTTNTCSNAAMSCQADAHAFAFARRPRLLNSFVQLRIECTRCLVQAKPLYDLLDGIRRAAAAPAPQTQTA